MKKNIFSSCIFALLLCSPLSMDAIGDTSLLSSRQPTHIHYQNTVLARVNGKAVTLYDVVKKMDMIFYRQFPQFRDLLEAKYQFYTINWSHFLKDAIDKELVLADAEENKINISAGDIRQEMETLFAPNIIASLDQIGISYDEAWNLVKSDMIIKRMMMGRVNPKAQRALTPLAIRKAYEKYAAENINPERWRYQVISFRDADTVRGADVANHAYQILTQEKLPLDSLVAELEKNGLGKETNINISEEFYHTPKEVSEAYRTPLTNLFPNTFSRPTAQKSKAAKTTIFRIFYLKAKDPAAADPLEKVEGKIKEKIFAEISEKETDAYFTRIGKRFAVQKFTLPEDYQPFSMQ